MLDLQDFNWKLIWKTHKTKTIFFFYLRKILMQKFEQNDYSHRNISKKMEREGDIAKLLQTEFDLSSEKP